MSQSAGNQELGGKELVLGVLNEVGKGDTVMEIKLPVPVKELAAISDALCKIHGKGRLFMRQVGTMLQIYKINKD